MSVAIVIAIATASAIGKLTQRSLGRRERAAVAVRDKTGCLLVDRALHVDEVDGLKALDDFHALVVRVELLYMTHHVASNIPYANPVRCPLLSSSSSSLCFLATRRTHHRDPVELAVLEERELLAHVLRDAEGDDTHGRGLDVRVALQQRRLLQQPLCVRERRVGRVFLLGVLEVFERHLTLWDTRIKRRHHHEISVHTHCMRS